MVGFMVHAFTYGYNRQNMLAAGQTKHEAQMPRLGTTLSTTSMVQTATTQNRHQP